MINYTLPEFVFLDGNSHEGDSLEHRTVLQHVRSYTIVEVIDLDSTIADSGFKGEKLKFEHVNMLGVTETHLMVVHFSLAEYDDVTGILEKCREWYCSYLDWEDKRIIDGETAVMN